MAKIVLNTNVINAFAAAKTKAVTNPYQAKQDRKSLWAGVREQFGIPQELKLGFDDLDGQLYVKNSNPRAYLQQTEFGVYDGFAPDAVQAEASSHSSAPANQSLDDATVAQPAVQQPGVGAISGNGTTVDALAGVQALLNALEGNGKRQLRVTIEITSLGSVGDGMVAMAAAVGQLAEAAAA